MSLDRELPNSPDAERATLGAVLCSTDPGGVLDRVAAIVTPSDFYREPPRLTFAAMLALRDASKPIDMLFVKEELSRRGELARCGGAAYVSALVDGIPDIANVERHAEIVREKSRLRRIITEGNRLMSAAMEGEDSAAEIAARSSLVLSDLSITRHGDAETLDAMMRKAVAEIERRATTRDFITGVPFSIPKLDGLTGGAQSSVINILGSRPAMGKTAFVLTASHANARAGRRVLFIELDMSPRMVNERLLASVAGVKYKKIQTGQFLKSDEWERIGRASAEIASLKDRLVFDYTAHDLGAITALIRREARKGLDLVILDHVGHVDGVKAERRDLEIGKVTRRMLDVAGETGAAVLLLVQINREGTDRPTMRHLQDSGRLEQDARLVILLDRPSKRDEAGVPECDMRAIVAKNEGEAGVTIPLHFDGDFQRVSQHPTRPCSTCGYTAQEKSA